MTSLRYLTCLFLLTVSLADLSNAGCRDEFTKNAWKKDLTNRLPDYISIQMDRKPEDVMECSIKNTEAEPTLEDCFENTADCEGESRNINVPFYHLMCLIDIAMNLTEKESKAIAAGVCKVYEKVCKPFLQSSSTPAPKTITATASPAIPTTATAPPSSPKMTTPTSSKATASTPSPSPTTATAPPSSPKMTTPTSSKASTPSPSPTTATAPPSSPKMTTPTSSKATASTPSPTTATAPLSSPKMTTSTSSTATTVSPTTPTTESATAQQSASERTDKNIGACATNETDIFKLQIVIAFLIFTNVLGPLAVYMYMRHQRKKESFNNVNRNMSDTIQMTIQPKTVVQTEDSGEGAFLLKTSQCSIIINPTPTENLCQNGLVH